MKFTTILEAVAYHAEYNPEKVCMIDAVNRNSLTYGEFWKKIKLFATRLRHCGLQKGNRVVVRVGSLIDTFVAQYGINLAGGVYCPLEKHMKVIKLVEMLEYYDSSFLISNERIDFEGNWIGLSTVCEDDSLVPEESFIFPNPEDMCSIVFTTGTTGKAKGVMVSFQSFFLASEVRRAEYAITEDDVYYWVTPIDRASGMRHFGITLAAGCTAVHFDGVIFLDSFFKNIGEYAVTVMHLQSFALSIVLRTVPNAFRDYRDQLRAVFLGGGNITERKKQQIQAFLPATRLFIQYGSTEATTISSYEFSRYPEKINCVGKPFPCTKIYITDDKGRIMQNASKDNLGIIEYEGPCGMIGYWKDPELTAKTMIDGRIIMTDVGYMDKDGFLYLLGRRDDVIVSGGYKIAPYEIENIAMQMPGISECVCVPLPDDITGAVPKLFIVMEKNVEFSAKEIYGYLAARLETFKLPRFIREIEMFPRVGASQKINRKALLNYD